jgi:hypothetical protein
VEKGIGHHQLALFLSHYNVNPSWWETDEGDIFKPAQLIAQMSGNHDICCTVDIYNMVDAGPGREPEWHEPVDRKAIPARYLKNNIRPVMVKGRSMEPAIMNGAIIGVDQKEKQVIEGEVYAIMLPYMGAAVKRLYLTPEGVLVRSDNKEFPESFIRKEDIGDQFILGRNTFCSMPGFCHQKKPDDLRRARVIGRGHGGIAVSLNDMYFLCGWPRSPLPHRTFLTLPAH